MSSLSLKKPSARTMQIVGDDTAEYQKKLVLDLPKPLHKRLKQVALDRGVTMRALVIEWIEGMKG